MGAGRDRLPQGCAALPRRQHGMSLVELMVAVSVFSIGMVAVATLQISGMRHTKMASLRAEATVAAHSLIEEMRANYVARSNNYAGYLDQDDASSLNARDRCYRSTTDCAPALIAELSMSRWLTRLGNDLPQGKGIVCIDSTVGDATNSGGTFSWACDGTGDNLVVKVGWEEVNPPNSSEDTSWQIVEIEAGRL